MLYNGQKPSTKCGNGVLDISGEQITISNNIVAILPQEPC